MKVDLVKADGNVKSKVELPEGIFGIKPNSHAVYMAVRAQMTNRRQGTHASKTRGLVSGGGKKPWRQKGRGTARAGTTRSPIWKGGGTTFGPMPRNYKVKVPSKIRKLARISALADKYAEGKIRVVEDFTIDSGKTRDMFRILKDQKLAETKTLLLIPAVDKSTYLASRNIPLLNVKVVDTVSTYDILNCNMLLLQQSSISKLQGMLTV